jgi:hypothetical protein
VILPGVGLRLRLWASAGRKSDLDEGEIGRGIYGWIAEGFEGRADLRVFVCYHQLIPIPGTGRERVFGTGRGSAARRFASSSRFFARSKIQQTSARITAGTNRRDDDRLERYGP